MDELTLRSELRNRATLRSVVRLQQQIKALADALTAVAAKTQRAAATITGPFAVGSTDVTITWPTPWPDTAYGVIPTIVSGTAALGSLDATLKSGTKTTVDCVVTVANTGANPVGTFALDVIGIRT